MTTPFNLELHAHRILFGERIADSLANELHSLGIGRFLLIATPGAALRFDALTGELVRKLCAGRFTGVAPHVPEPTVLDAIETARKLRADGLVAWGGGSSLDTAKALSHRTGLPTIAVPTNFSGSEVTFNYGLTVSGVKKTVVEPRVLPKVAIYDWNLLEGLPQRLAACSGINAIAHAVEALYAPRQNPLTAGVAEAGIRAMVRGLQLLLAGTAAESSPSSSGHSSSDSSSSSSSSSHRECLAAAWLCGEVLAQAGMGLHHRLCHVLGGTFNLPHAETHAVLLPYVIEFNQQHAPQLHVLDDLFAGTGLACGLQKLAWKLGAPHSLADLHMRHEDIGAAASNALSTPVANPRRIVPTQVCALLGKAWAGEPVSSQ